jgi:hypothetical protein
MYLLVHTWDHSTRKVQPQSESEFSKFYKREKSIAVYYKKKKKKKNPKNQSYNSAPNYIYETNDIMLP